MTTPLSVTHPEIASEWHLRKNGDQLPNDVPAGSNKKVWWRCSKGSDHEWLATPNNRTSAATGCPYCAGKKPSVTNSLASLFPDIAVEWHQTRNTPLSPDEVVAGSNQRVWWKCANGPDHEWLASVSKRTAKDRATSCPFCAGKKVSVTNSLSRLHPDLAAQWHPTKNGELTPQEVPAGSHLRVWWLCPEGSDHEWQAAVSQRVRASSGCPCCSGRKASAANCLASAFPEIAVQWHPSRNGDLTPDSVPAGSNKRYWWLCSQGPDHEWQASVSARTAGDRATGCPYCAGKMAL
jgi:hypothetical protein